MTKPAPTPELLLRLQRRSLFLVLILIAGSGAFVIASSFWPDGAVANRVAQVPWLFPMIAIFSVSVQQTWMRKHHLTRDMPEYKAMMNDEWRRSALDRAWKGALFAVLIAQILLPLLFVNLPTVRALWGMAATTVTLGLATQIGLFLFFDRE